ncbi:hypothetical protein K438DRAFT_2014618 [Mycena galopus ATCC 62051]|nr:hypothetical protein K438DRAFT_2014618 [Mycena galopus ATCC 62051]
MGEHLKFIRMVFRFVGPFLRRLVYLRTQRSPASLAATVPTGFKVIFIEKNSHLNYSFTFPRFSVITGYEHTAFIPYDGVAKGAPAGLVTRIQDTVVGLTDTHVLLASGREVDYQYLAIATGSSQPLPVQVSSTDSAPPVKNFSRRGWRRIGHRHQGFYPEKDVTLIHSRDRILNTFGKRLHDYTLPVIRDELKIRVLLNERPQLPKDRALLKDKTLTFSDGREEIFDLVTQLVLCRVPAARLCLEADVAHPREANTASLGHKSAHFALGDVAETGGPKMGRAGLLQGYIVLDNILAMIHNRPPSANIPPAES